MAVRVDQPRDGCAGRSLRWVDGFNPNRALCVSQQVSPLHFPDLLEAHQYLVARLHDAGVEGPTLQPVVARGQVLHVEDVALSEDDFGGEAVPLEQELGRRRLVDLSNVVHVGELCVAASGTHGQRKGQSRSDHEPRARPRQWPRPPRRSLRRPQNPQLSPVPIMRMLIMPLPVMRLPIMRPLIMALPFTANAGDREVLDNRSGGLQIARSSRGTRSHGSRDGGHRLVAPSRELERAARASPPPGAGRPP